MGGSHATSWRPSERRLRSREEEESLSPDAFGLKIATLTPTRMSARQPALQILDLPVLQLCEPVLRRYRYRWYRYRYKYRWYRYRYRYRYRYKYNDIDTDIDIDDIDIDINVDTDISYCLLLWRTLTNTMLFTFSAGCFFILIESLKNPYDSSHLWI